MPDFFDKLREQIDAGLTKVTTKSRVTLETTRLSGQVRKFTKEKEEALARLGAQVYQDISQTGQLNLEYAYVRRIITECTRTFHKLGN